MLVLLKVRSILASKPTNLCVYHKFDREPPDDLVLYDVDCLRERETIQVNGRWDLKLIDDEGYHYWLFHHADCVEWPIEVRRDNRVVLKYCISTQPDLESSS